MDRPLGPPPMEDIRVLDHGHVWAGPLVGLTFADLGAEVIKVTAPARPSGVAMGGQAAPGSAGAQANPSATDPLQYHGNDRGKRSITLDLADERGKAIYKQLVAVSDVIVENFSPRVMPSLGLGYEDLQKVNPGIILASLSATGATPGPWRDLVTYGPSLAALYGIKSLLGYVGDPMPREDTADLDPTAAGHAAFAILAALEYRERTGKGQHIEMAQGEATIQRIAEPVMDYLFNRRVARTQGNRYPGVAPHGIYRAAGEDEWISIVARNDREWAALLETAGSGWPGLAQPQFATLSGRLAQQDDLDQAVEAWTSGLDANELTHRLQAAGVPAYPVMGPPSLLADPNFDALRTAHIRMGPEAQIPADDIYAGIPWKLTRTPGVIQRTVPASGADNAYVFCGLLGISDADLEQLKAARVI